MPGFLNGRNQLYLSSPPFSALTSVTPSPAIKPSSFSPPFPPAILPPSPHFSISFHPDAPSPPPTSSSPAA
eukprot:671433-Prymnesium_polylepis.1